VRSLSASASRLSFSDVLQQRQKQSSQDATRLLRNLWLAVGVFRLLEGPRGAGLLPAAGRIAAATPLLLIDAGPDRQAEALERLRVEFGERVAAAGAAADVGRMASALARLAAPRDVALSLVAPASRLMCAYLFSIATCETVRCGRDARSSSQGQGQRRARPALSDRAGQHGEAPHAWPVQQTI
jgi:hypothetical protein